MFPFTPRYLKHAKLMLKGVTRFLDYKRDLLPPTKLAEINGLRDEFKTALRARDRERLKALSEKLNEVCEKALPATKPSWIADNVEVMFVAIVIALGIRAYVATLFQIPTGSMQPTLNGITAVATEEDPTPNIFGRLVGRLTGERYVNVISDHDGVLKMDNPATKENETLTEHRFLIFMPYCKLHFEDGHTIKIGCPKTQLLRELQLDKHIGGIKVSTGNDTPDQTYSYELQGGTPVRKDQLLARGILRNGDQVIVDKMSYHFRAPKRGEVFVFTTNNIAGIEDSSNFDPRHGSQHYIKRLAGVPGDYLEVKAPKLFINDREAEEPGFQRVMQGTEFAPVEGYRGYADPRKLGGRYSAIELRRGHYFAMGDNSYNSSDSRVWGTVPDRNLVGPALWTYWPLNKHWGPIE
jgi:signal peptidase I